METRLNQRRSCAPLAVLLEPLTPAIGPRMSATSFPLSDAVAVSSTSLGPELANIYLHARYYDSSLGIFLSPDPIGADSNTYRYAGGDPANYSDPSGLCTEGQVCMPAPIPPTGPQGPGPFPNPPGPEGPIGPGEPCVPPLFSGGQGVFPGNCDDPGGDPGDPGDPNPTPGPTPTPTPGPTPTPTPTTPTIPTPTTPTAPAQATPARPLVPLPAAVYPFGKPPSQQFNPTKFQKPPNLPPAYQPPKITVPQDPPWKQTANILDLISEWLGFTGGSTVLPIIVINPALFQPPPLQPCSIRGPNGECIA